MRKHFAPTYHRRPSLDSLENRYLLSGGIEVIRVSPPPALVIAIDFRETLQPAGILGTPAMSPVSRGFAFWQMPIPEFHHDPTPWSNAPPPPQGPPLAYPTGDLQRIRLDNLILHAARGLPPTPLPDEMTMNSPGNTDHTQGVTVAPPGNQTAGSALEGGSNVQLAPSTVATPTHVSALLNREAGQDDPPIRAPRTGESRGNEPVAMTQGTLPKTVSTTDADAHRGGDVPATVLDPVANGNQDELPLPHAAGLITNVIPFNRTSLEQAVDQFFDRLEDLGMGQLVDQGPTRMIPLSLAVLTAVTAVELARRRLLPRTGEWKATRRQDPLGSEELLGFPELPGSWSTRLI
jgi:hypothetical protein